MSKDVVVKSSAECQILAQGKSYAGFFHLCEFEYDAITTFWFGVISVVVDPGKVYEIVNSEYVQITLENGRVGVAKPLTEGQESTEYVEIRVIGVTALMKPGQST